MAFEKDFGTTEYVIPGDGLDLNLVLGGSESGPTVVFIHGFPDTHAVWLPTVARLVDDFRCVMYDVRGAGSSDVPDAQDGYRVAHLVGDLVAVIDHVSPRRPVHLVAHDWGSLQTWEAVLMAGSDPRLKGRIASYTTISGPAIGHFAQWTRHALGGSWRQRRDVARQLLHSWYILAFQTPWVPELVLRRLLRSPDSARRLLGSRDTAPTVVEDALNGLGLYRANLRHAPRERHPLRTDLPVQLIVPLQDPFITTAVYDDLPRFCSDLTRNEIDGGHWVQQSHPDEVAALVADFVTRHSPEATMPGASGDESEEPLRFVDDDPGYLAWLRDNPAGYVINTARSPQPSYVVLHCATCHTISGTPATGGHWTLDYIKVCGERGQLEQWALVEVGGPVHACGICLRDSS